MLNYEINRQEDSLEKEEYNILGGTDLKNPFPGLRPFSIDESHLFFGRESHVDEVLLKLATNRFVTVMGYSGSGKSSLISCGVVPIVYGGFMTNSGPDWTVINTRPGTQPVANLARALQFAHKQVYESVEERRINRRVITSLLKSNPKGLVEILSRIYHAQDHNTLVYIDQFEELFRYASQSQENENEARLFVNLILDACRSSEVPIYVAITMRSDFVGECAKYPGLTQLINDSNYLVPQMSREQKRMAIEGPVAVGGGAISNRLLKRLLNDVGDNQDQLPILQHALMRTWNYWVKNREEGEPMDIGHYNAVGQISEALSQHANETFDELTSRQKEIAEILFKSLSEKTTNSFGMRRPVRLGLVSEIAEASDEEVIEVIEKFREPGRSFLMPPPGVRLKADTMVEISHESLMRIWKRLKVWVDEEFESAQMYRRLSEAAAMYQIGRTGLWRPPDLQLALNWQKKQKPTRAWARRYDEAFERAIVFLDTSRITYEAEQRNQEMLQKRLLKRTKAVAVILGVAAVISILFFVYAFTQSNEAQRQAQLAEQEKLEAQRQTELAQLEKSRADEQRLRAEEALEIAEEQKKIAQDALQRAENSRLIAEQNFQIAQEQTKIANDQKFVAQSALTDADQQRQRAEANFKDAQRLLYQSIAQSMAVKSLTVDDQNLQGLLAQQAKLFFDAYDGRKYDPYIYDGLYNAYADFKGNNYNTLKGLHRNSIRSLAMGHYNDTFYSTGTQGKVVASSLVNSENISFITNKFPNRQVAVSPNDQWVAAASDSSFIQVVNLTNQQVSKIEGHTSFVNDIVFASNGKLYSSGNDKALRINDLQIASSDLFMSTTMELKNIAINNNKDLLAGGTVEGQLVLIDLNAKREMIAYAGNGQPIQSCAFSPDGKLIAFGDERGVVHIMDANSRELLFELSGHKGRVSTIAFSPDGKLVATGSFDGTIQMWPVEELDELPIRITDNDAYIWDIVFTSDSKNILSACADGEIRLWPTDPEVFSQEMCKLLSRNFEEDEWKTYVGDDIDYTNTCANLLVEDY